MSKASPISGIEKLYTKNDQNKENEQNFSQENGIIDLTEKVVGAGGTIINISHVAPLVSPIYNQCNKIAIGMSFFTPR
jgi:hypothetical protein